MRHLIALLVAGAACTPSSTPNGTIPINLTSAEARDAAKSVDAFAADLHAALPKEGNLFYSPTSIAIALAMTEQGARGATKDEMDKVVHLGPTSAHTYAALQARLSASKSPEIAIANRIYADGSLAIEPDFGKIAPLETVDFIHDAEGARGTINGWVAKNTRDRIQDLIAPRALDSDTRVVLTNAIYFKGAWATAFDPHATFAETFHGSADAQTPMMHASLSAGFGKHAGAEVLDLAYKAKDGPELTMVVLLPEQGHPLAEVETAYEKEGLEAFAGATSPEEVDVTLPKLKMTTELQLGPVLEAMGMPLALGNAADFSGITHTEAIKIAKVIHKAFVDVSEEGTEAAAATAVIGAKATAVEVHPRFRADHPFLFFIRDRASGVVLFTGRCADPQR